VSYPVLDDLQALLLGHPRRPVSRTLLFGFGPAEGARRMLAGLAVTFGDSRALGGGVAITSLGITAAGLRALDLGKEVMGKLDPRFLDGLAPKRLGDHPETPSRVGDWWEQRFQTQDIHCLVHIYAGSFAQLVQITGELGALAAACGAVELIPRADGTRLDGAFVLGPRKLHFGYTDGISGPRIAWDHPPEPGEVDFRQFVLGYATFEHSSAPRGGPAADLIRGSSYGVFRWIHQDVARFNRFLAEEGPRLFPGLAVEEAEELLAAKLMGRWRDGTPLVLAPEAPSAEQADRDDFSYRDSDPDGLRCPFSAHIRVMNPRDDQLAPTVREVPVVLRRGMPYGPPLVGAEDDGVDRGLLGLFLCSNILRQILTLTMWAQQNDFADNYSGAMRVQDALVGNRAPTADHRFIVPGAGTIARLPSFLTTKGTALALYPGRATLHTLAAG
jgi:deferrochelatase/peroxidase EfeB